MRLFVAVDIAEDVREKLSPLCRELVKLNGLKVVESENLHITLMFLGEVEERKLQSIRDALANVKFEPFKVSFAGVGAFPSPSSPRVVWVDVVEGREELKKLADSVFSSLKRLGFRRDKEFVAHVTVARVKRRNPEVREVMRKFSSAYFGEMVVDRFKLKRSILRQQGPIYKDLEVYEA